MQTAGRRLPQRRSPLRLLTVATLTRQKARLISAGLLPQKPVRRRMRHSLNPKAARARHSFAFCGLTRRPQQVGLRQTDAVPKTDKTAKRLTQGQELFAMGRPPVVPLAIAVYKQQTRPIQTPEATLQTSRLTAPRRRVLPAPQQPR